MKDATTPANPLIKEVENALKNTTNREKALWYFFGYVAENVLTICTPKELETLTKNIKANQEAGTFSP